MNRSFYNGVSGIKTHQFGMDVWSHNISNINNVGYRAQIPEFENIFSQTLSTSIYNPVSSQVGLGSTGQTTAMSQVQGGLVEADNPFDMALTDEGWFGTMGLDGQTYYTRRGDFSLDAQGNLVARNGNFVLGTVGIPLSENAFIDQGGSIELGAVNAQQKIKLPQKITLNAVPTTSIIYKANLNPKIQREIINVQVGDDKYTKTISADKKSISFSGDAKNVDGLLEPKKDDLVYVLIKDKNGLERKVSAHLDDKLEWNIDNFDIEGMDVDGDLEYEAYVASEQEVATKQKFSTHIISPKGERNLLVMEFTKKVPNSKFENSWDVVVKTIAEQKDENGNDVILSTQNGEVKFGTNGAILTSSISSVPNGSSSINLSLGTPYDSKISNTGFNGITSIDNGNYGAGVLEKDGYVSGSLSDYSMDEYGQIYAHFDNGKDTPVAKIAVYHFQNDQGLTSEGGDYFLQSANSGKPIFYKDAQGKFTNTTSIQSHKLEMSNVSLGTALTEVIVMQKAFDASSKSITTSDQMIQNAINLKR